jgi:hypothetical protein
MISLHETFDQADAATAIAAARAAYDRDPTSLDAVAMAAFELWARPDQLARAGQPATQPAAHAAAPVAPAQSALDRVRARVERNRATAADARAALLAEINRKHGHAAAKAARDLSIDALVTRAAAPTREAISASWDRVFKLKGIAIHEDDPNETPIQQSWTRAFRRCGATVETSASARPMKADPHGWSKAMARHGASL